MANAFAFVRSVLRGTSQSTLLFKVSKKIKFKIVVKTVVIYMNFTFILLSLFKRIKVDIQIYIYRLKLSI